MDLSLAFLVEIGVHYQCKKKSGHQPAAAYRSHPPILNERRTLITTISLLKKNVNIVKNIFLLPPPHPTAGHLLRCISPADGVFLLVIDELTV